MLAVDAGSNQISVLRIKRDGALELADIVSSGGIRPVSIAEHDGLVYAANAGVGGENYTGFTLNDGGLRPLAASTVSLPDGAQPADVLFKSTGTNLVGTCVGSSQIDSFRVDPDLGYRIRWSTMYAPYIARRTQIYLDDDQDRQLAERARQVGRTKSALIRDAIDAYLSPATNGGSALAGLRAAVKDAAGAAPYLPAGVDYVEELRAIERERQRVIDARR